MLSPPGRPQGDDRRAPHDRSLAHSPGRSEGDDGPAPHQGTGLNGRVPPDPWAALRRHTPARIALGRSGCSLPTAEVLRLASAHARARDAVHVPLDTAQLAAELAAAGWPPLQVASQAPTRPEYLRRPDWGRRLRPEDAQMLREVSAAQPAGPADLVVVVADGLSALAAHQHALPVLQALHAALLPGSAGTGPGAPPPSWAPVVIATQARVALADDVGAALQARLALILLGERPGLSAADSLGAYLTWAPQPGRSDAERNCVSNIRPDGLPPAAAGQRLGWLVRQALRRRVSGVALKDDSATQWLPR